MGSQTDRADHDLATFPDALRGKRILLCTESFGQVNGVSRTTTMLVNHLRSNGAVVAVVAPDSHSKHEAITPPGPPKSASTASSGPDIRVRGYPLPFNPELSVVYPVRLSTLYRRTFGAPPDLIYLASPASLGFQVLLHMRQLPEKDQVPVICNFQTDLSAYTEILFPSPLNRGAVWIFDTVQSFLFRHSSVKTLFYPSSFVGRYLERIGVQPQKLELVQRGVDTELFHPRRRSEALRDEIAPDGEIILICVARLAGEKGFDFLASVARELEARFLLFKLYIVGGNRNAAVEAEVKAQFGALAEKGKVIFAGFKIGEDLATAYASADLFLHCSVTETFGLVVLESMASGVPVVARDEGGPSDTVQDGETGFLVPPADVKGFSDAVMRLVEDERMRKLFSDNARQYAQGTTWEKINNKVAWCMHDTIDEADRSQAAPLESSNFKHQFNFLLVHFISLHRASNPATELQQPTRVALSPRMSWPFYRSVQSSECPEQLSSDDSDTKMTSCHSRPHSGEHSVCKKYKEVRFACPHKSPANAEGLQWYESWDVCDEFKYDTSPGRVEQHWKQRPNQKDDYEPGVKVAHYSCLNCWKDLIVLPQFNSFQAEWEPRILKSDWKTVLECARFHVETTHPTQQIGRWCCAEATDQDHKPFSCKMASILQKGAKRKIAVEQGWSDVDYTLLWERDGPYVPLGTDCCVVS
ncbi:UDP-Glycosyltransferase/glycogen phosphorylase [Coniochaeta ligniaria NRRL 30616]|uniref:UDP-Glycosyltransferase/glycogen phosphorylase n=1 Tax=Coniochaeta ligniaria NRRL 30616 TaxID=1408157 RepID=A0A1J7JRS5_9PEZI|nr:UDP-Glycosyltransferase/glycogen phosphorylase [Coniochaeta ligniaria NRRL 30616]